MSYRAPAPPEFPVKNRRANGVDLNLENLLYRLFDLRLSGIYRNFEYDGVLRLFYAQALFGDDGPANHFVNVDVHIFVLRGFVRRP
jgi:hypothetical protein